MKLRDVTRRLLAAASWLLIIATPVRAGERASSAELTVRTAIDATGVASEDWLPILEPRFCARLAALACAGEESAARLTADLAEGRFDRKWGALTVALWLEEEMSVSPDSYRRLVEAGPDAVLAMAERHLPGELAAVIRETAVAEQLCRGGANGKQ